MAVGTHTHVEVTKKIKRQTLFVNETEPRSVGHRLREREREREADNLHTTTAIPDYANHKKKDYNNTVISTIAVNLPASFARSSMRSSSKHVEFMKTISPSVQSFKCKSRTSPWNISIARRIRTTGGYGQGISTIKRTGISTMKRRRQMWRGSQQDLRTSYNLVRP